MAGFNFLDWAFGWLNAKRSYQATNARPYTTINPQSVAPENDTIRSDATALPYRADDLDDFGCETDAMRAAYLRLFREEPSLKSAVEGKAESIASLDVMVQPANDKRPDDVRAAKFVEWAIKSSPHGWDGLFLNVLKPAFLLGWSCQEIVLRHIGRDESAEWGGMIGLQHCRSLNTNNLRLSLDAYRNVLGVVNTVRGLASYPRRKVLLFTHNELFNNPFGSGDAATAYRDASVIDAAFRLWGFAIRVYGGPFLKGKYSEKDRRKQLEAALDAARQGGWITMHKSDEVEVINLATATSFTAFSDKIKKHEERVYTAVRGAYLPYMQGQSGGDTRGSADTSKSAGSDPKEYLVGVSVCRAINRDVVPHLVKPNFPPGTGMPEVRLGGVNWAETKTQLDVAGQLKELGHEVEEEYLAKVTGMPLKPKPVMGPGASLPGVGPGQPPASGQQPPPAGGPSGQGGSGGNPPSGPRPGASDGGGSPATLPPGPPNAGGGTAPAGQPAVAATATNPATNTAPPELLFAMLTLAERGDHDGVDALTALADDPVALADLLASGGDGDEVRTFAEGGFTGTIRDSIGRKRHYVNGKQVKASEAQTDGGGPHTTTPLNQTEADQFVRGKLLGASKISLQEVKNIGFALKHMTVGQIRKLKADVRANGQALVGGKLKGDHIAALMAYAQTHKQEAGGEGEPKPPPPPVPPVVPSPPVSPPPPPPTIDYKQKDPDHPVAKQIAGDHQSRAVLEKALAELGPLYDEWKAGPQFSEYLNAHDDANRASLEATRAYQSVVKSRGKPDHKAKLKAQADELKAKADDLNAKAKPIEAAYRKAKDARDKLFATQRDALVKAMGVPEADRATIAHTDAGGHSTLTNPTPEQAANLDGATSFVTSMTGGQLKMNVRRAIDSGRAACYGGWSDDPLVTTGGGGDGPSTYVHELGHVLEHKIPGAKEATKRFLEYRTAGEQAVDLRDKFGDSYDPGEMGRKDNFDRAFDGSSAYYVGKIYYGGATEVVSMGIQKLHDDPVRFMRADPEYAQFIIGLLRGKQ